MIWLDIVIVVPLLWGAYTGYKKGLIAQVLGIVCLVLAIYLGTKHPDMVHFIFEDRVPLEYLSLICFVALFLATVIIGAITIKLLEKIINTIQLKKLNQFGGVVLGVFKICAFLMVIVFTLESWGLSTYVIKAEVKEKSIIYPILQDTSKIIIPNLKPHNIMEFPVAKN